MNLTHTTADLQTVEAALAVVGAFAGEQVPAFAEGLFEAEDFKGSFKQTFLLYTHPAGAFGGWFLDQRSEIEFSGTLEV
jgi:hypothetical protein